MSSLNARPRREGYLMIDHRASPGLPDDIARAIGMDPRYAGGGKLYETKTLTCEHCKGVVLKNPLRTRERGHCAKCSHYVCDGCFAEMQAALYVHTPFEALVEANLTLAEHSRFLGSPRELLETPRIIAPTEGA